MNYRKLYEEKTGEKIPAGYVVHHLDLNRNNNNIKNLVALPKKLHGQFHYQQNAKERWQSDVPDMSSAVGHLVGNGYIDFWFSCVQSYCEVYKEVTIYLEKRNFNLYRMEIVG